MRRSSNVSKSIDGFRHLTKNVSAISTALSIRCGLSKFSIKEEFPGLQRACGITTSQCMECWETPCKLISQSYADIVEW